MDNYQLYSTNILLSGQLKWDLILESSYNELYVDKFNISPVSDNIAFDYKLDDDLLNYSHQENISRFYKSTEGSFFKNAIDDKFLSNYPLIKDEINSPKYSDKYFMGARRSKPFTKYYKEIEFLCPLWIEDLNDSLSFTININSIIKGIKNNIASKTLVIKDKNIKQHDKFVKYFNNYIKYIGLDNGDNKLINLDFDKNICSISGISLKSGNKIVTNNDNIINNITDRERPMMEVDDIIINLFKNNYIISKQLFNFNLCFNIEDILSNSLFNLLKGNKLNIEIIANIGGKELLLKDFFTNYEYIGRLKINSSEEDYQIYDNINIFDYLKDNKYLNFVDKNKFSPNVCHWSLITNNEYIFNLYSGFGSYYIDNNGIELINQRYLDSPDLKYEIYNKVLYNVGWCNHDMDLDLSTYKLFLQDKREFIKKSSLFNFNTWTNNVYYSDKNSSNIDNLNVYICCCNLSNYTKILNTKSNKDEKDSGVWELNDNTLFISPWDNCLLFITTNADNITYKGIIKVLSNINDYEFGDLYKKYLRDLKQILNNVTHPKSIRINKSIIPYVVDGPSTSCNEIEYFKKDNTNSYVYRYDGYIKPTFISKDNNLFFNYLYEKQLFDKSIVDRNLLKTNFEFIYPSIQFCFYKNHILNYDNNFDNKLIEYKWYNNSMIFCLDSIMNIELDMDFDNDINHMIKEYFKVKYGNLNDYEIDYIISLYNMEMTYDHKYNDYSNLNNISEQIKKIHCNIKLILK